MIRTSSESHLFTCNEIQTLKDYKKDAFYNIN